MSAYKAVLFDLLSALLDSYSVWGWAADSASAGRRWRQLAARRMQATERYEPYEAVVAAAAKECGLTAVHARRLIEGWARLAPWDDVPEALASLEVPFGIVTNCSESLARLAVSRLGREPRVVVSAERAGAYKPAPAPYLLALSEMSVGTDQTLYVAGSRYDVEGALRVGMTLFWVRRSIEPPIEGPAHANTLRQLHRFLDASQLPSRTMP